MRPILVALFALCLAACSASTPVDPAVALPGTWECDDGIALALLDGGRYEWSVPEGTGVQIASGVEDQIRTNPDGSYALLGEWRLAGPTALGVDIVLHSATKYLGGHSDLTAGVIAGKKDLVEKARLKTTKLFGGNISPQTAWLVLRGIKTLALRMERHNANAEKIAAFLAKHPKVSQVNYPGLASHPNHEIARKQMRGFGGMISFDVGTVEAGKALLNNVKLCTLATSLGGIETIIQHSASMTHAGLSAEQRLKAGVTDGLIRFSVGIENADDLIFDLEQALDKI